ncbi:MAG: hypothetical protein H0W15_06725 [Gemmatimonadales bacterium]|nr:hypothetical protein [Gemmatimonadales bacterium]
MRHARLVLLIWIITATGAFAGSIAGSAFGRKALFVGAMVGGTLALLGAIRLVAAFGWLDADRQRGGAIGGLVGFGFASTLAVMHLQDPIIPVLVVSLAGVGVILGAGPGAVR